MNKTRIVCKWTGSFIEILRVKNGFALYDFSIARYQGGLDGRRPMPIVVFETKAEMVRWLTEDWADVYEKPFGEKD